jgi:DNA/RNA-binding domain of Phe-tRNA-synthetase-like protein
MLVSIENEVLEKYPETEIGYLVARVSVKKEDPFVESLKHSLRDYLESQGINATNFAAHSSISIWRKIYEEDFQVKAKTHRSSIEALVRRIVIGKEIWNIYNIVDLYNCCSILSLLPMGAYDLNKVSGDIKIRYAKEGETFLSLGERKPITIQPNHVVYADDKRVICWLWNHKDSEETCIDEHSEHVVFFIDSFEPAKLQAALKQLRENLEKIQCTPLETGILNKASPCANLNVDYQVLSQ